jgi:hypothetical protein
VRPASLRQRPPRDPRARIAGLMLLPRTIDKARGLLPGGDPADYVIEPGWSAWLLAELGFTQTEFLGLVRRAANEAEITAVISERVTPEKCEALNETMKSMRVADVSPDVRAMLDEIYHADPDALLIDIIVADDRARLQPRWATR